MAIDIVRVNERSTRVVDFDLYDHQDSALAEADILTATLTLFDLGTFHTTSSPMGGIINNRNAQNVLNANDVTVSDGTSKLVTWTMQSADNPIVDSRKDVERHRATFVFTTSAGELRYMIEIEVKNLGGTS
jgi:hypothetical protein